MGALALAAGAIYGSQQGQPKAVETPEVPDVPPIPTVDEGGEAGDLARRKRARRGSKTVVTGDLAPETNKKRLLG